MNPSQRLSQRPFVGSIFTIKICMLVYLLVIHLIKNKDCDWLRPSSILKQQSLARWIFSYVFKEYETTKNALTLSCHLKSTTSLSLKTLRAPRSFTYEPCDGRYHHAVRMTWQIPGGKSRPNIQAVGLETNLEFKKKSN